MGNIIYRLDIVFQITNTVYGVTVWLVLAVLCGITMFVLFREKITVWRNGKVFLYSYLYTYGLIFILLGHMQDRPNEVRLGWVIGIILPAVDVLINSVRKRIRCK